MDHEPHLVAEPPPVWMETLGAVIADLCLVNQSTEQDFLEIGGKLAGYMHAVAVVSSELATLANLEEGLRASQALTRALDCALQLQTHQATYTDLLDMLRKVTELKQNLSAFHENTSAFHTLGMMTRIEVARLGNAHSSFNTLGDEVNTLAADVQDKVLHALDIADSLIRPIEVAIQTASAIQGRQAEDLPPLISDTLKTLSFLRDVQVTTRDSSVRLQARYETVRNAFKELIVSVQFHDITRQQVEHVVEVLQQLHFTSTQNGPRADKYPRSIAAILALQSAQLADAGGKFAASVSSVERNLEIIAHRVREMADESRTLTGLSCADNNSFLLEMEQGCNAILESLSHSAAGDVAIESAKSTVAETIGRMHRPIDEIRPMGLQMRILAINARISAAQIGSAGNTLDVLADLVQQLAIQCKERSDSMGDILEGMAGATTRISTQSQPEACDGRCLQSRSIDEMRMAVAELHSTSERSLAEVSKIVAGSARLADELSATRSDFSVGALFAAGIASGRERLAAMRAALGSDSLEDCTDEVKSEFAHLEQVYSVQSERDVHENHIKTFAEKALPAEENEQRDPLIASQPEAQDNIEFF